MRIANWIGWSSVALGAAFVFGYWVGRPGRLEPGPGQPGQTAARTAEKWICSMHPQIQLPGAGQCPMCGMDLIPVATDQRSHGLGPRQLRLSKEAMKLAEVEVWPVERRFLEKEVRLVGKAEYDETRLSYITAWVPGRLDRLYVDYTGVPVQEGDHMVSLYSPALLTAQEELLQAFKTARNLEQSSDSLIKERARETLISAREKLRLWGLTPSQIEEIETSGVHRDHLTIYAPVSGIVVQKDALEGMYVSTGSRIYSIADLSQVWVKLDAYESDLPWIHYGQEVSFEAEAYPGERFGGRISFIDPMLNPKTRTVKVRVNVANLDGRLKPGMFVRAVVRSRAAASGKVMDPTLAGKWISPMHPEIIKDEPGTCDICGMPLVKAEDLGYLPIQADASEAPLVIPASAPLITGRRAVVYVALTNQPGLFEGREISLGPRADDAYIVKAGLQEGDLVVVHGNFKIDSAIQIQARPSMMNPGGGGLLPRHDHGLGNPTIPLPDSAVGRWPALPEFRAPLGRFVHAYLEWQTALAADDLAAANVALDRAWALLPTVDSALLPSESRPLFTSFQADLRDHLAELKGLPEGEGLGPHREALAPLSEVLWQVLQRFGPEENTTLRLVHCPMAFQNRGARWIQVSEEVRNPYFGVRMLNCGQVVETISATVPASHP